AAARFTDQPQRLAGADVEADVVHGRHWTVGGLERRRQPLDAEQWIHQTTAAMIGGTRLPPSRPARVTAASASPHALALRPARTARTRSICRASTVGS